MRALIVGAGIGRTSAALALRRWGIEVAVYERAAELREVGAGLAIAPNAMRALGVLGRGESVPGGPPNERDGGAHGRGYQRRHGEPVLKPSEQALTRSRLSYVDQNYIRAGTITQANARLVDHQVQIPLAQTWGGGRLASVDGMRFKVPVRTVNAAPSPKYFGRGKGITYINFVSDQATGFYAVVVPGTLRDSLYVLDGLLEHNTILKPHQVTGDTHTYTDIVFGLYRLLGYLFSPRIADLEDRRYWRLDKEADYGPLNGLARDHINTDLIAEHWDDILRVAGSLLTRTVKASDILKVLQADGKPRGLGKAIGEIGKIPKSVHLLNYLNDETYRRSIGGQLNLHEERHALARASSTARRVKSANATAKARRISWAL